MIESESVAFAIVAVVWLAVGGAVYQIARDWNSEVIREEALPLAIFWPFAISVAAVLAVAAGPVWLGMVAVRRVQQCLQRVRVPRATARERRGEP